MPPRDRPEDEIEITPEMMEAAEEALWNEASLRHIRSLDEIPRSVIGEMIRAALRRCDAKAV